MSREWLRPLPRFYRVGTLAGPQPPAAGADGMIQGRRTLRIRRIHYDMSDPSSVSTDAIDTLIQRCLGGDQSAWEDIVRQHRRKVFNIAYKFTGRHDEAEDLTQDIFLKIFKSLHTFDRRANFQTWLVSVSRNLCIDHYRSVRKERETIDRDVDAGELTPAAPGQNAYQALEQRDRVELLRKAMAELPPTLREAVVKRDIHGHPGQLDLRIAGSAVVVSGLVLWLVVASGVDVELSDELAGGGVDDPDVEVLDEHQDAGSGV